MDFYELTKEIEEVDRNFSNNAFSNFWYSTGVMETRIQDLVFKRASINITHKSHIKKQLQWKCYMGRETFQLCRDPQLDRSMGERGKDLHLQN